MEHKILKMIILVYEKDEDLYTMFDILTVFANPHQLLSR